MVLLSVCLQSSQTAGHIYIIEIFRPTTTVVHMTVESAIVDRAQFPFYREYDSGPQDVT